MITPIVFRDALSLSFIISLPPDDDDDDDDEKEEGFALFAPFFMVRVDLVAVVSLIAPLFSLFVFFSIKNIMNLIKRNNIINNNKNSNIWNIPRYHNGDVIKIQMFLKLM